MSFINFCSPASPGRVLARDLITHEIVTMHSGSLIHLDGVGELARAGQCSPGECGFTAMGRRVVIIRPALRGTP